MSPEVKYVAFLYLQDTDPNIAMATMLSEGDFAKFDTPEQAIEAAADGYQLVAEPDNYKMALVEIEVFQLCEN